MPAGVFTDTTLLRTQRFLMDWMGETSTQAELQHETNTCRALLENQTAKSEPILEGSNCVGMKAMYLQVGASTLTYNGATARAGEDCTTPAGKQAGSYGVNIDQNVFVEATVEVNEKCDNEVTLARETAYVMQKGFLDLAKGLNERCMGLLEPANQVLPAGQVQGITPNPGDNNYNEISTNALNSSGVLQLQLLARLNKVANPVFINGSNFLIDSDLAKFRDLNSDSKEHYAIYSGAKLYFDPMNLDAFTTKRATFLVNPNNYYFWNKYWSSDTRVIKDPSRNRYVWRMDHPFLMYRRNSAMPGEQNFTPGLQPVQVEVEYEHTCVSRVGGQLQHSHKYFMRIYGGHGLAPAGQDDTGNPAYTGVIGVNAI